MNRIYRIEDKRLANQQEAGGGWLIREDRQTKNG